MNLLDGMSDVERAFLKFSSILDENDLKASTKARKGHVACRVPFLFSTSLLPSILV